MFVEFKEINLFCEECVGLELDRHLNILDDECQRARIEKSIRRRLLSICSKYVSKDLQSEYRNLLAYIGFSDRSPEYRKLHMDRLMQIVEQSKVKDIFDRTLIMNTLIWVLGIRANLVCTDVICECTVKMYKQSGYQKFTKYDKNLLMNIDSYSIKMISTILKFRYSRGFSKYHSGCSCLLHPESLMDVFQKMKDVYPDEDEVRILGCLMYFSSPLMKYANDDDYRIVQSCKLLFENELSFLDLTYKVLRFKQATITVNTLFSYAQQIDSLRNRYGKNWREIFDDKIPDITSLEDFIFDRANSKKYPKLKENV